MQNKELLKIALQAAWLAGQEILDVYSRPVTVELKADRSPVTEADKRAHRVIVTSLSITGLQVLSEEGRSIPFEERKNWKSFWMVDPLDGTKEFIKHNGEFTVNIALIENQKAVIGIVYAPVKGLLYYNIPGQGSFRIKDFHGELLKSETLFTSATLLPVNSDRPFTVVASRSHMSAETADFINDLRKTHNEIKLISSGSSLKLCLVAEGSADIYPRFAPTMEWDTAAGHAVVSGMGKDVIDADTNKPLLYNKENLLNPWFIVK